MTTPRAARAPRSSARSSRTSAPSAPSGVIELPAGADPAMATPRPDIERAVYEILKPLGGVQVWAYALVDLGPSGFPCAASMQVDIRASSKALAWQRADAARRAVCTLPLARWPEGVVSRADVIDGPFWFPDNNGAPRYVARYRVVFRPRWRPREVTPP